MRRLLSRVALAAAVVSVLCSPAAWAAPTRTLEPAFLMSRLWSVLELVAARVSHLAEKDGSLMDPHGVTSQGGSQMDREAQRPDDLRPRDASLMDPDG